jgi:hypothetical protein
MGAVPRKAFERLVIASQQRNIKLHKVAREFLE